MPPYEMVKRDTPGPQEPQMLDRIPRRKMTNKDRCDQCGAAAWAAAEINGTDLLFCAHHFTKYEDALRALTDMILDERDFLYAEVAGQKAWAEPNGESSRRRRPGFNTGS